jgi:PAS domain S-box-containing protein
MSEDQNEVPGTPTEPAVGSPTVNAPDDAEGPPSSAGEAPPAIRCTPTRLALVYAVLALLWLALTGPLLRSLVSDPALLEKTFAARDVILVAVTAGLLVFLLSRHAIQPRSLRKRVRRMQAPLDGDDRFRALVQWAQDMILVVGPSGAISYASPSIERILGHQPADLIGRSVFDLVHPEDRDHAWSEFEDVLKPGDPTTPVEVRVLSTNGRVVFLETVAVNLLQEPSVRGVVITARVVNERKRAQEELARHAREMEALYDTSLELTAHHGLTDLLEAIVQRAADLLGARMGGVYLVNPDGASLHLAVSHNLPGNPVGAVIRFGEGLSGRVAQMGKPMMVEDYSQWVGRAHIYEGVPFRRVLAVPLKRAGRMIGVLDVADEVKTGLFSEEQVRLVSLFADQAAVAIENARLLEETQRRAAYLQALTELAAALRSARTQIEMPSIILGQLAALTNASAAALILWEPDASRPSLTHAVGSWQGMEPPDLNSATDPMVVSVHRGQTMVLDRAHCLPGLTWPARIQSENAMIVSPLISEERIIGVLSVGRANPFSPDDVRLVAAVAETVANALNRAGLMETLEQRVAARTHELAEANLRLQELDRLKSDFVSNVSHELRTPITNILLYTELLDDPAADERRARYLGTLRAEAQRLGRLIEDLLTLSRIERDALPLDLEPHALDPLLSEVVAAHLPKAAAKDVHLSHEPNPELPVVIVCRERIVQVFNNLLANALAYGSPGGLVRVTSQMADRNGQPHVSISFYNDGPAIACVDLPHIFERFYRGRSARESGEHGTGLGLAISKDIAELHDGWIDVESSPAEGTTFTVWLPARPPAAS